MGITGRVFRDLGKLGTPAARIVLGAAVIDDVLGLVILAVVSSLVKAGSVSVGEVSWIIAKAVLFLAGSIWLGRKIAPHSSRWLAQLDSGPSMLFAQVLATGLALAWLAHAIGLAPIIGAFAAGLLFEPLFLKDFETPRIVQEIEPLLTEQQNRGLLDKLMPILQKHTGHQHEHMIEPIGYFFVPVFFVLTGMQVDLQTMADPAIVAVALGITAAAVAGKLARRCVRRPGGQVDRRLGHGAARRGRVDLRHGRQAARRDGRGDVLGDRHHGHPDDAGDAPGADLAAAPPSRQRRLLKSGGKAPTVVRHKSTNQANKNIRIYFSFERVH